MSKFPDILSMSIFCPLKRKTQRITQGGIGGLYCTNQIKPARKEEKRREKKRREEKRKEEKRGEEKRGEKNYGVLRTLEVNTFTFRYATGKGG